jgi:pyochelin synthetase
MLSDIDIKNLTSNLGQGYCIPPTELQKAYLLGRRQELDLNAHAHLYLEYRFHSHEFCKEKFRRSIHDIYQAYPILSARFDMDGNCRIRRDNACLEGFFTENNECILASFEEVVGRFRDEFYRADSSLFNDGCLVFRVIQFNGGYYVQSAINLILLDGFSVRKILSDLSKKYMYGDSYVLKVQDGCLYDLERMVGEHKSSVNYRRAKDYWVKKLSELPSDAQLPQKNNSVLARRSHLRRRKFIIDRWGVATLTQLSKYYSITLTGLILTIFGFVLAGWSRERHFYITVLTQYLRSIGSEKISEIIANLAGTALVELNFKGAKCLEDGLNFVNQSLFRANARSAFCGLEILQLKNSLEKSTARAASPVAFVSMIAEEGTVIENDKFQLEGEFNVYTALETPQVVLDHQVISRPDGGISFILDGMDEAFDDGVVEAIFLAYENLVRLTIQEKLDAIKVPIDIRPREQRVSHQIYNLTDKIISPICLHDSFYRSAEKYPENLFVIEQLFSISYEGMRLKVNGLARVLRENCGVMPGDFVGVNIDKSWMQVLAVLAISASGAAYVPLDPQQPIARKMQVLSSCRCKVILSVDHLLESISSLDIPVISLTDHEKYCLTENMNTLQTVRDLAYVIFTSGSTGVPKGVAVNHLGPFNTIYDINNKLDLVSSDRIFCISELNFDLSVYDIFGASFVGAGIVIPPVGSARNPEICLSMLKNFGVTIWNSVPALAQLVFEYAKLNNRIDQLSAVRAYLLSGDWIPVGLPGNIKAISNAKVLALGGATEASIWSIYYPYEKLNRSWRSIPYGYPLTNQKIYILDDCLNHRPNNVPGEIYIGGIGLANEYWNDEEKTSNSFVIHEFIEGRIYKTGDWGVMRDDGYVEFLGRIDGQVKVRGYRIELGDIESALGSYANITASVANVINDGISEPYIALFYLSNSENSEDELKKYLSSLLPGYMVPTRIIRLTEFPLSPNGKVDKKNLPNPLSKKVQKEYVAPKSDFQRQVADLWAKILNTNNVSLSDDFFQIGGNSFSAVRMITALGSLLNRELQLAALLQNPVLEDYCARISSATGDFQYLVELGGFGDKLFAFHPVGGNVACYRVLADALGHKYQIIGVSSTGDFGQDCSLEDMVSRYLCEIREMQPSGPYCFAGWSMGGVLAYEAARQLELVGERISILLLLDAPCPKSSSIPSEADLARWFFCDILSLDSLPIIDDLGSFNEMQAALESADIILLSDRSLYVDLFEVFKRNLTILNRYSSRGMLSKPYMFYAAAQKNVERRVSSDRVDAWLELFGERANIKFYDCSHYQIVGEEFISYVVNDLSEYMASM